MTSSHDVFSRLEQLNRIGAALSKERDINRLLDSILIAAMDLTRADGGTLYLLEEEAGQLAFAIMRNRSLGIALGGTTGRPVNVPPLPLRRPDGTPNDQLVAVWTVFNQQTVNIQDARQHTDAGFDFSGPRDFDERTGYRSHSFLTVPMKDHEDQIIGVLQLINATDAPSGATTVFTKEDQSLAESLASQAAIALTKRRLILQQEALFESFIQVINTAIDDKSPYTGGHCQRVPVLTKLLAQAACQETEGPFASFQLSDTEWEELHIAAWLHDCGKVTTPEYIVDKATKLETLYDRIHEIRMRFEVLKRDAEISYWKALAATPDQQQQLKTELDKTLAELDEEFNFIATCNEGGEFMAPDKIARIKQIAERSWTRTLPDRIGISHDEKERKDRTPEPALPVTEQLLSDKPEHIFSRSERDNIKPDNPWGFKVKVPEHLYNRGEVYNLTVARGTLSEEERYKINEHMIQTIMMLEKLPFPRHLAKVPEIAGGHHEKMDGTGYPKRLMAADMSIPARMMAIADIFEALTAADRPYKKGKTLSEAIKIMSFMKKDQHIDAELFALFLKSGTYLEYGRQFMNPEQIDEVDIHAYV